MQGRFCVHFKSSCRGNCAKKIRIIRQYDDIQRLPRKLLTENCGFVILNAVGFFYTQGEGVSTYGRKNLCFFRRAGYDAREPGQQPDSVFGSASHRQPRAAALQHGGFHRGRPVCRRRCAGRNRRQRPDSQPVARAVHGRFGRCEHHGFAVLRREG